MISINVINLKYLKKLAEVQHEQHGLLPDGNERQPAQLQPSEERTQGQESRAVREVSSC
ncbi:uncharacterized protein LOC111133301 isoform X2 [Crassostrea virginica]